MQLSPWRGTSRNSSSPINEHIALELFTIQSKGFVLVMNIVDLNEVDRSKMPSKIDTLLSALRSMYGYCVVSAELQGREKIVREVRQ